MEIVTFIKLLLLRIMGLRFGANNFFSEKLKVISNFTKMLARPGDIDSSWSDKNGRSSNVSQLDQSKSSIWAEEKTKGYNSRNSGSNNNNNNYENIRHK